jgi:hypothetical protein
MDIETRMTYMGLRAFNFLYNVGSIIGSSVVKGVNDFGAYMAGRYNIWHFLAGELGPLPDSVVNNRSIANIEWSYNVSNYTLTHNHTVGLQVTSENPWLTAAIRMGNIEYDMDEFIRHFKWVSNIRIHPSRRLLLYTWSIHSGIWLSESDNPILRVITHEGEQVDIAIFGDDDDEWERLLVGDEESESEDESDSGNEAGSDEAETEESESEESEANQHDALDTNVNDTLPSSDEEDESSTDMNIEASPILQATPNESSRIESDTIDLVDIPVSTS